MKFSEAVVAVKEAYDIEDYIESSGVSLKRSGVNNLKGLCPFHNEKTPSFVVNTQFQRFTCFGCKESGDIITYVEKTENLSFSEALHLLADDKGIEIEEKEGPKVDYAGLRAVLKDTANFFYVSFKRLPEDHPAKAQISERGLVSSDLLFGYAPEGSNTLYRFLSEKRGHSDDLIVEAGVCKRNSRDNSIFDFWHGRLMFFLTDIQGRPVGFSGRKLYESDPLPGKYVNSSDSPVFHKHQVLFNVVNARKHSDSGKVYICEGQFDVAALDQAGLKSVVASSGTAFTENQANTCMRIAGESGRLVFCFDGDKAGLSAAEKVFSSIPAVHSVADVVVFPDGMDPCDYRLKYGDEPLKSFIGSSAVSLPQFVLSRVEKRHDLDSATGRASYIQEAADVLASMTNRPLMESLAAEVTLKAVASFDSVMEAVDESKKSNRKRSGGSFTKTENGAETRADGTREESELEEGSRYEDNTSVAEDELRDLIKKQRLYSISARLVGISPQYVEVRDQVRSARTMMPDPMREMLDAVCSFSDKGSKFIMEKLPYPRVSQAILTRQSAFMDWMSADEVSDYVSKLVSMLEHEVKREQDENRDRKILSVLSRDGATVDDLKKVYRQLDIE